MVTLKEAFKLTAVSDQEAVYLEEKGQKEKVMSVRQAKEKYDLKATKVVRIYPKFNNFNYKGMKFWIVKPSNKVEKDLADELISKCF